MKWEKLGVLVAPSDDFYWMESHVGPSFAVEENEELKIFITGRDRNNVSRIGIAKIELAGKKFKIKKIEEQPVFDVGALGTFDESGVSYPWLVNFENKIYLYYVGWVAGGKNRFQNFTGLAISKDGGKTFTRVKKVPVIDRTDSEPVGSGSCCVFIEDNLWKMYYTSFEPWVESEGKNKPVYNIKYAYSSDGINWIRERKVVVDFKNEQEHIICKPMLLKEDGIYKLWYSHRGESYRIGYSESQNGINYSRKDEQVGIDVTPGDWDGNMIEYSYVFDYKGNRYMIYNGNDFGKTGLGIAILVEE